MTEENRKWKASCNKRDFWNLKTRTYQLIDDHEYVITNNKNTHRERCGQNGKMLSLSYLRVIQI